MIVKRKQFQYIDITSITMYMNVCLESLEILLTITLQEKFELLRVPNFSDTLRVHPPMDHWQTSRSEYLLNQSFKIYEQSL